MLILSNSSKPNRNQRCGAFIFATNLVECCVRRPNHSDVRFIGVDRSNQSLSLSRMFRKSAYPAPTREPSVKAVIGHMYVVHTKDRDNDHSALFRVEALQPSKSVTISWKLIPSPE